MSGLLETHINGVPCSVQFSYYAGSPLRHWDDTPDMPEFDVVAVYDADGKNNKELRESIDDRTWERLQDEVIEWEKERWLCTS